MIILNQLTCQHRFLILLLLSCSGLLSAQQTQIQFELNGRPSNRALQDSIGIASSNPFSKFIGEWTLKNDSWTMNWGYGDETILIPKHHTICSQINTENSLLSIIDGPEPNGHIFWTYNTNSKEVSHLSSFGDMRIGKGRGQLSEDSDLTLKISFEGEAEGSYRIYNYTWIDDNEYHMKSIQYSSDDEATGLFYEGTFIRITKNEISSIRSEVEKILAVLDDYKIPIEEQLHVYASDINHMAPNSGIISNKTDLMKYLSKQREYGYAEMKHGISDIEEHGGVVIMRGGVTGTFHPSDGKEAFEFRTKNLFVFKRVGGELKISKVIYNASPKN